MWPRMRLSFYKGGVEVEASIAAVCDLYCTTCRSNFLKSIVSGIANGLMTQLIRYDGKHAMQEADWLVCVCEVDSGELWGGVLSPW